MTFKLYASILIKVAGRHRWQRENTKTQSKIKNKKSIDKRNKKRYTNKVAKRGSKIKYEPWKLNSRIYNQFTDEKSSNFLFSPESNIALGEEAMEMYGSMTYEDIFRLLNEEYCISEHFSIPCASKDDWERIDRFIFIKTDGKFDEYNCVFIFIKCVLTY